jgi:hypothetical protein
VFSVLAEHKETVRLTLAKALRDPKLLLALLELAGRLDHELGPQIEGGSLVEITINTRLPIDSMMRDGAHPLDGDAPALGPARTGEWPDDPV